MSSGSPSGSRSTISRLQRWGNSLRFVEHEGHAAAHAGGEVAAGRADDDGDAAGHVFAAMVAGPFDDGLGPAVADAEALAGPAAEERPAAGGAVEGHVADQDVVLGHEPSRSWAGRR